MDMSNNIPPLPSNVLLQDSKIKSIERDTNCIKQEDAFELALAICTSNLEEAKVQLQDRDNTINTLKKRQTDSAKRVIRLVNEKRTLRNENRAMAQEIEDLKIQLELRMVSTLPSITVGTEGATLTVNIVNGPPIRR